jgi:hypothetical protein
MPAIQPAASPAASFTGLSLTRIANPDNLFELANAATEHCMFVLQRIQLLALDTSITDGPVTNLRVYVLAVSLIAVGPNALADDLNDYPTSARADYVFGCMKANGETQEILQKCSCSIDVIASIIPYDSYVTAETILSMSQVTGPVGSEFRSTEPAKLALQEFRRAQAEAEIRCF